MENDEDIKKLTDLLIDNDIDEYTIETALSIICNTFSFVSGAVYETDDIRFFYKKETYSRGLDLPNRVSYIISNIHGKADQSIHFIVRDTYEPSTEFNILDVFHTENLIIVPLTNTESQGFLVFTCDNESRELNSYQKRNLFIMTGLISRYIITRIGENKVKLMQVTYESIMDSTGIDIYVNDFYTHDILYVNKSMAIPYGGKEVFEGRKCWEVLFPGQTGPCDFCPQKYIIDENEKPSSVYTWDYQRAFDGAWFRVFSSAFYWIDGRLAHVVSSANITDNKQKEELIQYMANYDELTSLPNHRKLLKDGERIIEYIEEHEKMFLLFFDIDGFKAINYNYGHDEGDNFLIELSQFFKGIPMLKDCVYRKGGDEFVAIIHGKGITKMNVTNLSRFIHSRFQKTWILNKATVKCDVSIGVACYGEDAVTMKELLYISDMAMYQAKKKGPGNICYGIDIV